MNDRIINIEEINPLELYGTNDSKINLIKSHFPKLKIVSRGNSIKINGSEDQIDLFEHKLNQFIKHIAKFGNLPDQFIESLLQETNSAVKAEIPEKDIIVYGNHGLVVKARTVNQKRMLESYFKKDMVFAIGPAGTGKTYTAVALAVRALKNKEVKRIILTRPAVEAGENLGFLPGTLKDKLDPYLKPLYDALFDMLPPEKLNGYLETGVIEIAPLAYMRGRTLDHAFVILDEAQNATTSQLKMFLTRMGKSAKFYVTGDVTQIDLPKKSQSGLYSSIKILNGIEGIDIVLLNEKDVVRHKLVAKIISAYEKLEKNDDSAS